MNCNEISNYSTRRQAFGAARLLFYIPLEPVELRSSGWMYVARRYNPCSDAVGACVSGGFD